MSPVIAALDVGGSSIKRGLVTLPDQVMLVGPVPINALVPKEELLEVFPRTTAELVNGAMMGHWFREVVEVTWAPMRSAMNRDLPPRDRLIAHGITRRRMAELFHG